MVREDRVIMSVKALRRVHVLRQTREKKLTQVKAGILLGLTSRHIRRLLARVEQTGDQGLAHRGRGKPSNRRIPTRVQATVLKLYEKRYGDFGPTLVAETLAECHGITRSDETLRRWLRERGSSISRGGSGHIGRGGSAGRMWGNSSSWTACTMTGSRGAGPGVC